MGKSIPVNANSYCVLLPRVYISDLAKHTPEVCFFFLRIRFFFARYYRTIVHTKTSKFKTLTIDKRLWATEDILA